MKSIRGREKAGAKKGDRTTGKRHGKLAIMSSGVAAIGVAVGGTVSAQTADYFKGFTRAYNVPKVVTVAPSLTYQPFVSTVSVEKIGAITQPKFNEEELAAWQKPAVQSAFSVLLKLDADQKMAFLQDAAVFIEDNPFMGALGVSSRDESTMRVLVKNLRANMINDLSILQCPHCW